jgi:hypothetical protein
MTHFTDNETYIEPPYLAHCHNGIVPEQTDVQRNGGKACSKTTEPNPRPSLRRVLSARTYPEGGRQAWLVVFGSFAGMMACFGFMATGKSSFSAGYVLTM